MDNLREAFQEKGFVRLNGFFTKADVEVVRQDAKWVFLQQMTSRGFVTGREPDEREFESGMSRFFAEDIQGFLSCGNTCQHLISLHRLSLRENIVRRLTGLGVRRPNIRTRAVLYFNSRHLAKSEAYYKSPPHQDWRNVQGSLNAIVIWVPLADVRKELGALEVIPGSHVWGLLESHEDEWFRRIEGLGDGPFHSIEVNAGDVLFFLSFLVHRSPKNVTDSIRWSCHFPYNELEELTFISRRYPKFYSCAPQQDLLTKDFPCVEELQKLYSVKAQQLT